VKKKVEITNGVLTCNLGIPIVVVVCKTESFSYFAKEYRYDDFSFDFIQFHLRNFCLKYGASLIYTSVKEAKNIDLLSQYVKHLLLKTDFKECAQTYSRDSIFIPMGWDLQTKINVTKELHKKFPNEDYSSIICIPNKIKKKERERAEVMHTTIVKDDQEFLQQFETKKGTATTPNALPEIISIEPIHRNQRANRPVSTEKSNTLSSNKSLVDYINVIKKSSQLFPVRESKK